MIVFRGVVFPLVLRAHVGVSVGTYFGSHMKGIVLALIYAGLILPVRFFAIDGPVSFIVAGACTTTIFGVLVLIALPEVREWLRERVLRPLQAARLFARGRPSH
jgi:hypothetical protein